MPDLKALIRAVPDFPEPGVLFRDITPLLRDAPAYAHTIQRVVELVRVSGAGVVVAIESRGFLLGAPAAAILGLPLVPVRKPGKLPAARMSVEYELEYGHNTLDIHTDALTAGDHVVIVDDVLATGGTAAGAASLVEMLGAKVEALVFLIELSALGGRQRLAGYKVESILAYE